ncbi:hypothetical protein GGG16DRAFT_114961 [Schizophyllum commune]
MDSFTALDAFDDIVAASCAMCASASPDAFPSSLHRGPSAAGASTSSSTSAVSSAPSLASSTSPLAEWDAEVLGFLVDAEHTGDGNTTFHGWCASLYLYLYIHDRLHPQAPPSPPPRLVSILYHYRWVAVSVYLYRWGRAWGRALDRAVVAYLFIAALRDGAAILWDGFAFVILLAAAILPASTTPSPRAPATLPALAR